MNSILQIRGHRETFHWWTPITDRLFCQMTEKNQKDIMMFPRPKYIRPSKKQQKALKVIIISICMQSYATIFNCSYSLPKTHVALRCTHLGEANSTVGFVFRLARHTIRPNCPTCHHPNQHHEKVRQPWQGSDGSAVWHLCGTLLLLHGMWNPCGIHVQVVKCEVWQCEEVDRFKEAICKDSIAGWVAFAPLPDIIRIWAPVKFYSWNPLLRVFLCITLG